MENRYKQAAYKARMRERGFILVAEWIPTTKREEFKQFAKELRVKHGVTGDNEVTSNQGAASNQRDAGDHSGTSNPIGDSGRYMLDNVPVPPMMAKNPMIDVFEGRLKMERKWAEKQAAKAKARSIPDTSHKPGPCRNIDDMLALIEGEKRQKAEKIPMNQPAIEQYPLRKANMPIKPNSRFDIAPFCFFESQSSQLRM